MAAKSTTEAPAENKVNIHEYLHERVPFYAFKDGDKYVDDIIVGWNGKMYRIQRGETVMIPRGVYNILERSQRADIETHERIRKEADEWAIASKMM